MCVSAEVSFGIAGLLVVGGGFAAHKARKIDVRYLPLALFPVLIGVQQFTEGVVWVEAAAYDQNLLRMAALAYLFFVWLIWPVWVPYMTAKLEDNAQKRKLFMYFAQAGLVLGLILYLPNLWHPDWLNIEIIRHSIAYQCTYVTDAALPKDALYLVYLSIIALPPLLSSFRALNILGAGLVIFVPLTYFIFSYAYLSVLCFFAAIMTLYIIYVILEDRCATYRARMST